MADAVQGAVSKDLKVYTGEAWIQHEVEGYTNGIDVLGGVFGMFAVIALFVACLVIGNTFTIVIAQRTREMALLRCVGASRRQVFSSVLAEATVVGVVASAIGVVFGVALSALALALAREFDWGIPPVPLHLDLWSVFLPLLLGTRGHDRGGRRTGSPGDQGRAAGRASARGCSGGRVQGRRTAADPRLPAARRRWAAAGGRGVEPSGTDRRRRRCGVVPRNPGDRVAAGARADPADRRAAGAGGGVPARIAVANAIRNPKRTAATTSALLIGVTLISLTCVGIASVRKTFDVSMDGQYPVDLMVNAYNEKMPAGAEQQLRDIKGITQVVPVHQVNVKAGGQELPVTGIDQAAAGSVIHNPTIADQLKPGTALIDYRPCAC